MTGSAPPMEHYDEDLSRALPPDFNTLFGPVAPPAPHQHEQHQQVSPAAPAPHLPPPVPHFQSHEHFQRYPFPHEYPVDHGAPIHPEIIHLRTKEVELKILEERRRELEITLELERIREARELREEEERSSRRSRTSRSSTGDELRSSVDPISPGFSELSPAGRGAVVAYGERAPSDEASPPGGGAGGSAVVGRSLSHPWEHPRPQQQQDRTFSHFYPPPAGHPMQHQQNHPQAFRSLTFDFDAPSPYPVAPPSAGPSFDNWNSGSQHQQQLPSPSMLAGPPHQSPAFAGYPRYPPLDAAFPQTGPYHEHQHQHQHQYQQSPLLHAPPPSHSHQISPSSSSTPFDPPSQPSFDLSSRSAHHPHPSVLHDRFASESSSASVPAPAPTPSLPPPSKPSRSATRTSTSSKESSRSGEKRKRLLHKEQPIASCHRCSAPIVKLYLRGEEENFIVPWEGYWTCEPCAAWVAASSKAGGKQKERVPSASEIKRKRARDTGDMTAKVVCDVCFKIKGHGGIVAKDPHASIDFTIEFVCVGCDSKYSRCTDCGGGGGGRLGIGKWRCRELFRPSRKTCSLTHTRIGGAHIELGVWEIRELAATKMVGEVVRRCESMWRDRTLARLAIPEVLEGDVNGGTRSFKDIQESLDLGWPSLESVAGPAAAQLDPNHHRRYLGLTWVKAKARRIGDSTRVKPNDDDDADGEDDHQSTGSISGQPKSTKVIPEDCELVGLWVGDWNVDNGTLLISTSLPFEGSDGDDRSALTVGEIACRIVIEIEQTNAYRAEMNPPMAPMPALEHLWVVSDGAIPIVRDKMHDVLARKRNFLPLDEYLVRHPEVDPSVFEVSRGLGPRRLRGWMDSGGAPLQVLVRWLGRSFNKERLEELADSEIGKRMKHKPRKA